MSYSSKQINVFHMVSVSLRQKLVAVHKFEIYTYWKYQISLFQIKKNPVVNPAKILLFFLKKMRVRPQENFGWKSDKKNEVQKKYPFCARSFWRLLDVQYYFGILFWYNYWCPESLEYVRPLHSHYGRPLFQKVSKILPKNAQKSLLGHTSRSKMLSPKGATKFFLSEINFICMNFIRLQGLAAGTVSGRNNGLLRCYVAFGVRPKPGFSSV